MNNKYYIVKSIDMARALRWLTKENYFIFDDATNPNYKVYSFLNTPKLQEALKDLNILHDKYKNYK